MKNYALLAIFILSLVACGSSDEEEKRDLTYPEITGQGIVANPIDCQVYNRGDVIPFSYRFLDDTELGAFNIEIHNNFEHHSHGTTSVDCENEEEKTPVKPWIYNQDYTIPTGLKQYDAQYNIPIPNDIDTGNYHFMIRLTDKAGWQQIHSVEIIIQ